MESFLRCSALSITLGFLTPYRRVDPTGMLCNPYGVSSNLTFDSDWSSALETVRKLLGRKDVAINEWQKLFEIMHRLTTWIDNGSERITSELTCELKNYVNRAFQRIPHAADDHAVLSVYITEWQNFMNLVKYVPLPFHFLTRTSLNIMNNRPTKTPSHTQTVRYSMLVKWKESIFNEVKDRLLSACRELIERERLGEAVERYKVSGVRESFVEMCLNETDPLELYTSEFESHYLECTSQFYKARASDYLDIQGILQYIEYADDKLQEEHARADRYLDKSRPDSVNALLNKCIEILVIDYEEQILAECTGLIQANDEERLMQIYRLINKTPKGIDKMLNILFEFIKAEGLAQMHQNAETVTADCDQYVEQLLEMHNRFTKLISRAFYEDSRFLTIRDQAFKEIVNNTEVFKLEVSSKTYKGPVESRSPELLANYCDQLLRKSSMSKRLSSEEIDEKINNVLLVLKYITNKDVFMRFHKNHMTRRLVLETTTDQEKEETVVRRLREIGMPAEYVHKLSRMLQDIEINKDVNQNVKRDVSYHTSNASRMIDITQIKVLNAGAWSRGRCPRVTYPREVEEAMCEIDESYKKMHVGRRLYWSPTMSSAVITVANQHGKYDLEITGIQLSVLNVFNSNPQEKRTFDAIRLATGVVEGDLLRALNSLVAFPKLKQQLLLSNCVPYNQRNVTDSTLFWVNSDFCIVKNDKIQPRGKMNLIGRLQLSNDGGESEMDDVIQLRVFRVQEAINKIMKSRKKITSAQLQTELIEMLKNLFFPNKRLIKEQLEKLIEMKIIARDDSDMNIFVYVS